MTLGRHPAKATLLIAIGTAVTATAQEFPEPYLPASETLPKDQLIQWLEDWDDAMEADTFVERNRILLRVDRIVPKSMKFSGSRVLRYDNPEIQNRLIRQYLAEYAKRDEEPDVRAYSMTNPWYGGEAGADYLELLSTLVESTFASEVYEMILFHREHRGGIRELYLAKVNPETTLEVLLNAKLGASGNRFGQGEVFYTRDGDERVFLLESAFRFLSLTGEINPEVLLARRGEVRAFVRDHAKHFSGLQEVPYREEPIYRRWLDYPVRMDALGVLEVIAAPGDGDLVRSLVEDLPPPLPDDSHSKAKETKARENLEAKAQAILERIAP